jgi:hypothetical protein
MCIGGGGGTNTSAIDYQRQQDVQARLDEASRQARIALGREQIDRLFDKGETLVPGTGVVSAVPGGQTIPGAAVLMPGDPGNPSVVQTPASWQPGQPAFDQGFYDRRQQAYVDQALPALTDQFTKARDNMAFALARAGLTRSSVAADQYSELTGKREQAAGEIGVRAATDANTLRSQVADNKSNLILGLQASADPAGASNQALARTQQLAGQPIGVDSLGDVFGAVGQGIGSFVSGVRQKQLYDRWGPQTLDPKKPTSGSNVTVVG